MCSLICSCEILWREFYYLTDTKKGLLFEIGDSFPFILKSLSLYLYIKSSIKLHSIYTNYICDYTQMSSSLMTTALQIFLI